MSASDLPPGQRVLQDAHTLMPEERTDREDGPSPTRTYYEDIIRIPGYGDKPQRCQGYNAVGFCEGHGHVVLGQSSCGTRSCPDHWRDWLQSSVVARTARLAAYRHVQEGMGKRLLHVVVSPPQDRRWSSEAVWRTRPDAYDVAERAGVRGGGTITHAYRTNDRGDALFETAVASGDWEESDGKWKLLRDAEPEDWGPLQAYTEAAPHYHVLGACRDFDPDAVPKGWVAKNIGSFDRFHIADVESYRPMARASWYLGTHAAVQQGRQSATWFGDLHPSRFNPEEELTASEWSRIQRNAERAVTTKPGGVPRESGVEAMECPQDGCERAVVAIDHLRRYLDREGWLESLEPRERARVRGLELWLVEGGDRPPPGRRASKEGLLTWLEHVGGQVVRTGSLLPGPEPSQGRVS